MLKKTAVACVFPAGFALICFALPPSLVNAADVVSPAMAERQTSPAEPLARDDDDVVTVNLGQGTYNYDFGPKNQLVMESWTPLTNKTKGDIYWSGETRLLRAVAVPKREGVNNANIDYVTSKSPVTLNHKLANGTWRVVMNMGDARRGHDLMGVRAEGELISDAIDSDRLSFSYVSRDGGSETPSHFDIEVKDGELNIELFDNGGKDRYWVLTRLSLKKIK